MDLVDYGYVDEELEWFDIPSRPGCRIGGPTDLTGTQDKQLIAIVEALPDDAANTQFFETVLHFWIALPGARWNLGRREVHGDPDSRLVPIPLTPEALLSEVRRTDRMKIAIDATRLLYPVMFTAEALGSLTGEDGKGDGDLLDGLTLEDGAEKTDETLSDPPAETPAAEIPDPNARRPRRRKGAA